MIASTEVSFAAGLIGGFAVSVIVAALAPKGGGWMAQQFANTLETVSVISEAPSLNLPDVAGGFSNDASMQQCLGQAGAQFADVEGQTLWLNRTGPQLSPC